MALTGVRVALDAEYFVRLAGSASVAGLMQFSQRASSVLLAVLISFSVAVPQARADDPDPAREPPAPAQSGAAPDPLTGGAPHPLTGAPAPLTGGAPPRPAGGSPFAVRLLVDLPVTLGAGIVGLTAELFKNELPGPYCGLTCDAQSLNGLDRTVVGNHSAAAAIASDVLFGATTALPFALDLLDVLVSHPADGFRGYGQDVLVLAEVFAVNAGVNSLVKFAVRRPRPLVYDPDQQAVSSTERSAADASLSFYSQHSSTTFAMATAYSYLFMQRHPGSRLIVPVWLLSEGLAATTATLRVEAGKHFWTDVITGAVVGSAIGLLIPSLHRRALPAGLPGFASHLRLSATPLFAADRAGLLLTFE